MADTQLIVGNANYSSWSLRAWLALKRTGADFSLVRIPLDTPEFERRIAACSPTRQVPVLHHEGLVVWDSLAICEYLAERYPAAGLWPDGQRLRTYARSVCAEMHSGFTALRGTLPLNVRARQRRVELDDATQADVRRVVAIWEACRDAAGAQAEHGPYLFGEFGAADCFYAPVALRFETYGVATPGFATAYRQAVIDDPLVREWAAMAAAESETIDREEVGLD